MTSATSLLPPSWSCDLGRPSLELAGPLTLPADQLTGVEPLRDYEATAEDPCVNGVDALMLEELKEDVVEPGMAASCDAFDSGRADGGSAVKWPLGAWPLVAPGKASAAVAAAVLAELPGGVHHVKNGGPDGIRSEAASLIKAHHLDDTFYIVDLGNVMRLYRAWTAAMPRVVPFYAVKCYPEPAMLRLLAALGTGFDCASKGEVETVMRLGVPASRIIFAHPCKRPCDIRFARDVGVEYTTFDTESELTKIAHLHPGFKLVLRVRADDPDARVALGLKFGADPAEAGHLLDVAARLGLCVVGVSFHVGSACRNLSAFSAAIESAAGIFALGAARGFSMTLLDIGGGFSGEFDGCGNVMFGDIAGAINGALAAHFPPDAGVRVIAEPGRYFAEAAASLLTPVYGVRDRPDPASTNASGIRKDYWLTDGLYGSFNCILYDGQNPQYSVLRSPLLPAPSEAEESRRFTSTLWGPTCDSADVVYKDVQLPALRNGDWLLFHRAGAYTVAGACDFNGIEFTTPSKFYIYSESAVDTEEGGADEGADAGTPAGSAV